MFYAVIDASTGYKVAANGVEYFGATVRSTSSKLFASVKYSGEIPPSMTGVQTANTSLPAPRTSIRGK